MLRRARIEKIIDRNTNNRYFTATITWLDRDGGMYDEASFTANIQLSYGYISRSFGFQYYPVPGDIVLCGFCEEDVPVIIAFLTTEFYSKIIDTNTFHYYFRNIVEGEYSIKAFQGNEIYFDRKGSLRFITRDQEQNYEDLQQIPTAALNAQRYITKLKSGVDLTKQIKDIVKTEVTIGKVYDEEYKEEKKLKDESIGLQVIGRKGEEEVYKVQINVEGEIVIDRKDEAYSITIDKEGNITLKGKAINLEAKKIFLDSEPGVKGVSLQNWCNAHTHSNGNNGSPTGPAILKLPQTALANSEE